MIINVYVVGALVLPSEEDSEDFGEGLMGFFPVYRSLDEASEEYDSDTIVAVPIEVPDPLPGLLN